MGEPVMHSGAFDASCDEVCNSSAGWCRCPSGTAHGWDDCGAQGDQEYDGLDCASGNAHDGEEQRFAQAPPPALALSMLQDRNCHLPVFLAGQDKHKFYLSVARLITSL